MFYKPCEYYQVCANVDNLCFSCTRNLTYQDNFKSKTITDDDIFYPKYNTRIDNK